MDELGLILGDTPMAFGLLWEQDLRETDDTETLAFENVILVTACMPTVSLHWLEIAWWMELANMW